jgi:hypothetical protein
MAVLSFELDKLLMFLVPELVVWFEVSVSVVSFPSEFDAVENSLSIKSKFVSLVEGSLLANPNPQRLVLLVALWHHTMAIFLFKLDQLFILLVPALVVCFPSKPDVVQTFNSINSKFVCFIIGPLSINPSTKKKVVLFAIVWHPTMAIVSFKFDKLLIFHAPFLIILIHGSLKALLKRGSKQSDDSKRQNQ